MPSVNKVILIGNVTRDIELKFTPKGTAVCEIGLAINHSYKNDSGEKMESTVFADCTLWGKVAEIAHKYSGKGQPLYVEGRLSTESWTDKESGNKRSKLKVIGENIQLLGFKKDSAEPQTTSRQKPSGKPPAKDPDLDPASEDDIPF